MVPHQDIPTIRLVLADEATERRTNDARAVWHPGDSLIGYLQVSNAVGPTIMGVHIYFEGVTRTWVLADDPDIFNIKVTALEHKFLQQAQPIQIETGSCEQTEASQFLYKYTFNFTIPRILLPCDTTISEQLLHLPPSLAAGGSIKDRRGRTCMQPLISYEIRAVLEYHDPMTGSSLEVKDIRHIPLIPCTGQSPPLAIEDFPGEYTLQSTKFLTKMPSRNPFAEMTISMTEPSALVFTGDSPDATTTGYVKLVLRPVNGVINGIALGRWKCTINSQIHTKTFYSTIPLHGMPNYSMLRREGRLRVQSQYMKLQTWKISVRSWRPEGQSQAGENERPQDSYWTTTLVIPICVSSRLLPTFCSSLAAMRYALKVHVNITGIRHPPFVLDIPLQVLYRFSTENNQLNSIPENNHNDDINQEAIRLSVPGNVSISQYSELNTSPPAYDYDSG